jgi:hypothetical protein
MYSKTAIALGSAKEALLYFDYIVPVHLGLDMFKAGDVALPAGFARQILPPKLCQATQFVEELNGLHGLSKNFVRKMAYEELVRRVEHEESLGLPPAIVAGLPENDSTLLGEVFVDAILKFLADFGLEKLPIDCFGDLFSEKDGGELEFVISLPSLQLVDVRRCSWEQILEFRRDEEARDKLRRLRLFAYENYAGKSKDYVEDDILKRIADYDLAVKQWGFETKLSRINMVLSSKTLRGAIPGSLVFSWLGAPTVAVATTVGVGGILELGRLALEVRKQRSALCKLAAENPVSYISHARSKLGNPNDA